MPKTETGAALLEVARSFRARIVAERDRIEAARRLPEDLAQQSWAIGEICSDPEAQRIMFEIADNYERLAKRAVGRELRTK